MFFCRKLIVGKMKDYVLRILSDIYGEKREGLYEYGLSEFSGKLASLKRK